MSYEIIKNDYDRYLLLRQRDFHIVDTCTKQGPLDALRRDIMRRLERGKHADVPVLPRAHDKRQKPTKNVELPSVRA
jgi:hypothetical protein